MRPLLAIAALLAVAGACSDDPAASGGGACGTRGGTVCPADQFCDFSGNRCGSDDAVGRCMPRPAFCPTLLVPEPTCGCDGIVYGSPCDASFGGTDLDETGACDLEQGAFACGYRQCELARQFCVRSNSDVGGEPDDYSCRYLPAACQGGADCQCLSGEPCGERCTGDEDSGLTLDCPGG